MVPSAAKAIRHAVVEFNFWIAKGIMYSCAPVLPFSLGIPILETDGLCRDSIPLANLLKIKSARWGCVLYYYTMAVPL
eukprot:scaffold10690_cov126-Cylindrotheca_fusiformis.AAC.6